MDGRAHPREELGTGARSYLRQVNAWGACGQNELPDTEGRLTPGVPRPRNPSMRWHHLGWTIATAQDARNPKLPRVLLTHLHGRSRLQESPLAGGWGGVNPKLKP